MSLICGISIEEGDEKEQPLSTTISVVALLCGNGMLRSVPIFDPDILFGAKDDFDVWAALGFTGDGVHMNLLSYSDPAVNTFPIGGEGKNMAAVSVAWPSPMDTENQFLVIIVTLRYHILIR